MAKPPKESSPDYEVGYGKPPRAHQFKPGHPGHSKRTRKGPRNSQEAASAHLDGKMVVRDAGKAKRISRREVLMHKLYEKAIKGDNRAAAILLQYDAAARADGRSSAVAPLGEEPLSATEEEILAFGLSKLSGEAQ